MKRIFSLLLACVLCALCAAALAAPTHPKIPALETDQSVFRLACDAAGFRLPASYSLEGYTRTEFNADGHMDIVASLRRDGTRQRMLLLLLSGGGKYRAITNAAALPDTDAGGVWGDPLSGIEANEEGITLHIYGGSDDHYMCAYSFALSGDTFTLAMTTVVRWHDFIPDGSLEVYNYALGTYTRYAAEIEFGEYTVGEVQATYRFDAGKHGPNLSDFNYAAFPIDWEGFTRYMQTPHATATPRPTQRVTHRPTARPTVQPTPTVLVQCSICGAWMTPQELAQHVCMPAPIQCPVCQQWFSPRDYANHICLPQAYVQCPVCLNWYEEGNVYRNHICVSYVQ